MTWYTCPIRTANNRASSLLTSAEIICGFMLFTGVFCVLKVYEMASFDFIRFWNVVSSFRCLCLFWLLQLSVLVLSGLLKFVRGKQGWSKMDGCEQGQDSKKCINFADIIYGQPLCCRWPCKPLRVKCRALWIKTKRPKLFTNGRGIFHDSYSAKILLVGRRNITIKSELTWSCRTLSVALTQLVFLIIG